MCSRHAPRTAWVSNDDKLRSEPPRPRSICRPPRISAGPIGVTRVPSGQRHTSFRPARRPIRRRREADLSCKSFGWNCSDIGLRNFRMRGGGPLANRWAPGSLFRQPTGYSGSLSSDRAIESTHSLDEDTRIAPRSGAKTQRRTMARQKVRFPRTAGIGRFRITYQPSGERSFRERNIPNHPSGTAVWSFAFRQEVSSR